MTPHFLFVRPPDLETRWPFVSERLAARLDALGMLTVLNSHEKIALSNLMNPGAADGVVFFHGGPVFTERCVSRSPRLKMVGTVSDNAGVGLPVDALFERHIPIIDSTRGWAQSVAELGLCLALSGLRRVPWWHGRMAGEPPGAVWRYEAEQYCDDSRFVNGNLASKRAGVVGVGQIGRRVASWLAAIGAEVYGYDPFLPGETMKQWGATPIDLDAMMDMVDILFITTPPTPSARSIVSRERVYRLRAGALVVVITRAHGIDMDALRERIMADELAGAFDVYDHEPLSESDPLRGRANVIHTPHIAGRTRDSNMNVVDIIVEDFERILRGEAPTARLTREMIDIRLHRADTPS